MTPSIRRATFLAGVGSAAAIRPLGAFAQSSGLAPVRMSINVHFFSYLPVFVAVDRGYFRDAGIDLQITRYNGSSNSQLPFIANGQLDVTPVVAGPPLFNQAAQGFGAKLVASIAGAHAGYQGTSVLVVRKDLWESGAIRKPADLRGRRVDGAALGSPVECLALHAIEQGGLKISDVQYAAKERRPSDQVTALVNKAIDVQGTTEPTAAVMEAKGYGVRWLGYGDVIPWFQETYFAASAGILKEHPEVVQRFLVAYLRGVGDVAKSGPKWDAAEVSTLAKWSGVDADVIEKIGGPPYVEYFGTVDPASLEKTQQFWAGRGLIKQPVAVAGLVDGAPLAEARRTLKIR
ncbi:MAG: ABC transporter substrate-binding protein [bacterium]|nr:ABC transporter substrate-binding protein [bacterium]